MKLVVQKQQQPQQRHQLLLLQYRNLRLQVHLVTTFTNRIAHRLRWSSSLSRRHNQNENYQQKMSTKPNYSLIRRSNTSLSCLFASFFKIKAGIQNRRKPSSYPILFVFIKIRFYEFLIKIKLKFS